MTRDEFGGYCCKRWGKFSEDFDDCDNICDILGLDIEKKAMDLVKGDLEKRQKTSGSSTKHAKPTQEK